MLQKHLLHSGEAEARRSMYEKAGEMAAGMRKRFFPSQANEPWPSPSIGYGNTIVAKMISPETSSVIEHPLQRFFTHRLGEKLLQVIADVLPRHIERARDRRRGLRLGEHLEDARAERAEQDGGLGHGPFLSRHNNLFKENKSVGGET